MLAVPGIAALGVPDALAAARRRIILHAAVYGNFASSPRHAAAFDAVLAAPEFQGLDIIHIAPEAFGKAADACGAVGGEGSTRALSGSAPTNDAPDAARILRHDWSAQAMRGHADASLDFVRTLAARHPGRVRIHMTPHLGLFPALVIDDSLFFGHYAHAPVPAPDGYWFHVTTDTALLDAWLDADHIPDDATADQRAALRILAECRHAMASATTLHTGPDA
jgi:hypothetical protein